MGSFDHFGLPVHNWFGAGNGPKKWQRADPDAENDAGQNALALLLSTGADQVADTLEMALALETRSVAR